jgi:hypothetical protein
MANDPGPRSKTLRPVISELMGDRIVLRQVMTNTPFPQERVCALIDTIFGANA